MTNLTLDNAIFLVNPVSGKLSLNKKINIINEIIKGSSATVLVSDSVDDAISKCKSSMMSNKIVVACGGDGFQNIIAHQAIINKGIMAILPFGRGNDFANSLNIKSSKDLGLTDSSLLEFDSEPFDILHNNQGAPIFCNKSDCYKINEQMWA